MLSGPIYKRLQQCRQPLKQLRHPVANGGTAVEAPMRAVDHRLARAIGREYRMTTPVCNRSAPDLEHRDARKRPAGNHVAHVAAARLLHRVDGVGGNARSGPHLSAQTHGDRQWRRALRSTKRGS